jgi:prolyl-tRNA editing enzyme YbaK/EbsC (Cys-tRNA(Pro) deacylase)
MERRRGLVAVLVGSDRDPDLGRVARAVPSPTLTEVPPERATELTEFLAEALPPVGLPAGTRVIVDRPLAQQEVLYFAGGEATSMLKIRAADLVRATGAKVARVTK